MSALTITKKVTAVAVLASATLLSGCGEAPFFKAIGPTFDSIEADLGCFTWADDGSNEVETHWYGDDYSAQWSSGECATEQELLDYEKLSEEMEQQIEADQRQWEADEAARLAAEQAAYDAELPVYRSILQDEISVLESTADVLSVIVTFYCQSSSEEGNERALWDATEEVYDANWRAQAESPWPMDYWEAVNKFCAPYFNAGVKLDKYEVVPPPPGIEEPLPYVEEIPSA